MREFQGFIDRPKSDPTVHGDTSAMYQTYHWEAQPNGTPGKVEIVFRPNGEASDTSLDSLVVEAKHYTGPLFDGLNSTNYPRYYQYAGVTSAYQRAPDGGSLTEVTYLHPEETIDRLSRLPIASGFQIYDGGEFSLHALVQGVAERRIPMANQGASMAHDMLTHIHTWVFAPEETVAALQKKAAFILEKGKFPIENFATATDGTMNSPALGELIAAGVKADAERIAGDEEWAQGACIIDMLAVYPNPRAPYQSLPPQTLKNHVHNVIDEAAGRL